MKHSKLRIKPIKKIPSHTYKTSDGKSFVDESMAEEHEKYLAYQVLREELIIMARKKFSKKLGLSDDGDEFIKTVEIGDWNIDQVENFVNVVIDINTALNGDFKKFVDEVGKLVSGE
jgi:hypothetical protein